MKTYLSIDIDYWTGTKLDINSGLPFVNRSFIKRVIGTGKDISVFMSHEQMLSDIEKSGARKLVNVDYHSDLSDNSNGILPELNEGTWVNHLSFCKEGEFIWIYPDINCYEENGRCDSDENPFSQRSLEICGWRKVSRRCNKLPTDTELRDVVKIGFSISPDWSELDHVEEVMQMLLEADKISRWKYKKLMKGLYQTLEQM